MSPSHPPLAAVPFFMPVDGRVRLLPPQWAVIPQAMASQLRERDAANDSELGPRPAAA